MTPTGDGLSRLELAWRQRAQQNLQRWGLQTPPAIILSMGEEVAEMAQTLDLDEVDGDDRGAELLRELVTLGLEIQDYLEETSEDDDGNPLPPTERPEIDAPVDDPAALLNELDDLVPFGYQLQSRMLADYGDVRRFQDGPRAHPQNRPQQPPAEQQAPREPEQRDSGEPENAWNELDGDPDER